MTMQQEFRACYNEVVIDGKDIEQITEDEDEGSNCKLPMAIQPKKMRCETAALGVIALKCSA